ncbi:MAG: DNA polymerase III subunit delta [Ruminococcus sp.]|nr:DNA polymerase III subunit delta [Ruminococcus sp.]
MPEVSRKELKQSINKKQFDRIYLIFGEEKMYVKADTDYLIEKLMGKEPPEFNYHKFSENYNFNDIAASVQIVPFMSEYNVVKISDLDVNDSKIVSKSDLEQLLAIMNNVPDTTVLILSMPTLKQDPKKLGSAFAKLKNYVKKHGTVCEINRDTDISLARQIIKWADSRGLKIEQADAYKLQEYVGYDLHMIKNELDKLCNYVGEGEVITTEHIEMLVTKQLEANIFNLTDAIVMGDSDKAFEILDTLFYQKADANEIISVISMSYIDFYRARVAAECGVPLSTVAKDFGYGRREFALKKAVTKTKRISTPNLRESLNEITETTAKLRSVSSNERIMIESLVAKLIILATKKE